MMPDHDEERWCWLDIVNSFVPGWGDPWEADDEEAVEWDPMLDWDLAEADDDEDGEDDEEDG